MTRLNQILVVVLIGQLILGALVLLPGTLQSEAGVEALLPELEAGDVVGVTITEGDGRSIALARRGKDWVLAEAGDYPVLQDRVPELLDKIVELQTGRLVTETPGSHKRLKVDEEDFERLVEVDADGQPYRFYIGSSPSFGAAHVRVEGQDEVYLTSKLSAQDAGTQATDWVDGSYVDLSQEEVTSFRLENEQGTLEFAKEGDLWTVAGLAEDEQLDQSAVQTLLSRATTVRLLDPLGTKEESAYGLEAPRAVVTLETAGGTQTLRVGAQDAEDNSYVVAWSGSPYYVRVSEFSVQDLVEQTREDLLLRPTPEVEETPGG
jgi:hypothetical protein